MEKEKPKKNPKLLKELIGSAKGAKPFVREHRDREFGAEEKESRFCPVCASKKVKWLRGGNLGDQYLCECGYQGFVLKGTDEFIRNFKEELDKKELKE